MDTATELASLRTRAYGPDADIHLDARAMARLRELEGAADSPGAAVVLTDMAAADDPDRVATTIVTAETDPPIESSAPRWWQKVPAWTLVGGVAVVGLLVGLLVPAVMAPQAVAQLRPTSAGDSAFPFEWYVVDRDTLVKYEDYGDVEVWTAANEQGIPCLFVSVGQEWLNTGCAPGELDPTVDLNIFEGMPAAAVLDLPTGSVLRFVLRGGVVEVWVAEGSEPAVTP